MKSGCLCEQQLDIYPQQIHVWVTENKYTEPVRCDIFKQCLLNKPTCVWVGGWAPYPREVAKRIVECAKENSAIFQMVLYNIPNRDSGGFSAGGAGSRQQYLSWIREVACGIGNGEGIVILEPDALAHAHRFDDARKETRFYLLREAVNIIKKRCKNVLLYVDAGHPKWLPIASALEYLLRAGIRYADGISLNVANSYTTGECYRYGVKILSTISVTHGMVIDTSRNGAGPPPPSCDGIAQWANNPFLRIGSTPTLKVRPPNIFSSRLHALLWVKIPGESDGSYNGAPEAGVFWPEEALRLIGHEEILSISTSSQAGSEQTI